MPRRTIVQNAAQRLFRRLPKAQFVAVRGLDLAYQVALFPFRRFEDSPSSDDSGQLAAHTDEYNEAAEKYFAKFDDPGFLAEKPFSDSHLLATHLFDVAILIRSMRLQPGDVVAEIGAGTCWLSHMLNRFGCRTLSIDVSPTALSIGRRLFQQDARTRWSLEPQFLTYDGHTLPIADGSCDRVVIKDAFHHIPNQRELLLEMHRVLNRDGVVAMSEPGRGHGTTQQSLAEASTGVLENELVLEGLARLAQSCGFAAVNIVVASPHVQTEIPARDLGSFMGGKGFAQYWKSLCSGLEQHHYILMHKGSPHPTTRRAGRVEAHINAPRRLSVQAGEQARARLRIVNAGDTLWLAGEPSAPGWTRLGAHLHRGRELIDFDWFRMDLPHDVPPGSQMVVDTTLPSIDSPGDYTVTFDFVVEGIAWFADRGSLTTRLKLQVT